MVTMGLTSGLQVTALFGPFSDRKQLADITLSLQKPLEIVFWRLKHYLCIIVCQNGVYMEIKMAQSN